VLLAGESGFGGADSSPEHLAAPIGILSTLTCGGQGRSADDAQDLTQDFFARLLEKKYLRLADRCATLSHLSAAQFTQELSAHGMGEIAAPKSAAAHTYRHFVEDRNAEGRYLAEPVDGLTPERIYEKALGGRALERS